MIELGPWSGPAENGEVDTQSFPVLETRVRSRLCGGAYALALDYGAEFKT